MKSLRSIFFQKFFWVGLLSLIGVVCIFMVGILGSTVNPEPKDLPIGLVVKDEGIIEGSTPKFNFGESVKESLINNSEIPFEWTIVQDRNTAISQMNDRSFYATIVIPENTSKEIASLTQPNSQQPEIEFIINQGLNYTGSNVTSQIINQIGSDMNDQVRDLIYTQLNDQNIALPPEELERIVTPLKINKTIINNINSNSANGNAPIMFTQILWLSVFISSLIIFLATKNRVQKALSSLTNQLIGGILSIIIIVTTMVLFANYILDVNIPDISSTFIFLLFSGMVFFLLQNALINWIGLVASPIILLLFLFSIPVLNFPPEFLPNLTNTLLYSWIPLKFSVEGLREIFYFDNNNTSDYVYFLGAIGIGSLIIMSLSGFKKKSDKKANTLASVENS